MCLACKDLIQQGSGLFNFADILTMSDCEPNLLGFIKQLHKNANEEKLKVAVEKTFSMLLIVKYLGHEINFLHN